VVAVAAVVAAKVVVEVLAVIALHSELQVAAHQQKLLSLLQLLIP
jgi:hypothetical protein